MCSLRSSQNVPYCVEREHIREEINIFYTDGVGFFQVSTYLVIYSKAEIIKKKLQFLLDFLSNFFNIVQKNKRFSMPSIA